MIDVSFGGSSSHMGYGKSDSFVGCGVWWFGVVGFTYAIIYFGDKIMKLFIPSDCCLLAFWFFKLGCRKPGFMFLF